MTHFYEMPEHHRYLPTPEEIAAACKSIQQNWSEREFAARAGLPERRPITVRRARNLRLSDSEDRW